MTTDEGQGGQKGVILGPDGSEESCRELTSAEKEVILPAVILTWTAPWYREWMLTFREESSTRWMDYSLAERHAMLRKTRTALEAVVDPSRLPKGPIVVLSQGQLDGRTFKKHESAETIWRLPDAPKVKQDCNVRTAKVLLDSNICGM